MFMVKEVHRAADEGHEGLATDDLLSFFFIILKPRAE